MKIPNVLFTARVLLSFMAQKARSNLRTAGQAMLLLTAMAVGVVKVLSGYGPTVAAVRVMLLLAAIIVLGLWAVKES